MVQHAATQRIETGLDMRHLQALQTPAKPDASLVISLSEVRARSSALPSCANCRENGRLPNWIWLLLSLLCMSAQDLTHHSFLRASPVSGYLWLPERDCRVVLGFRFQVGSAG
jgi:hypothetical protein